MTTSVSNFSFLAKNWPELHETAQDAEQQAWGAPRECAFLCRLTLETAVNWIYDNERSLERPYQTTLSALMHEQPFKDLLPSLQLQGIQYVRKLGNIAAHERAKPSDKEVLRSLQHLHGFLAWLALAYSPEKLHIQRFDENLLPRNSASDKSQEEIRRLTAELERQREQIQEQAKRLELTEADLHAREARLTEIERIKAANAQVPLPPAPFSEKQTREQFIDLLLREAGWDPAGKNVAEYEVQGMPNNKGIGYADYVLWGEDGKPLAVVEAKHTLHTPQKGQHQAKLYADCLEAMHGQRPVIYYSNGFETWMWDDLNYPPRQVFGIYSRDALQRLVNRRGQQKDLRKQLPNRDIAGRYYQEEAIKRVADTFQRKTRASLLVMATGSGKTRTAAALVDLLMKAGWVTRVLFLADRTALVRQAMNNFAEYLPHLSLVDLTKEDEDTTSRVVFSTYPTIMNRIDGDRNDEQRHYGIGHFDLVIIDEAHRSVYQRYKAIFDYFDSLLLGLTATPKAEIDRNTYELFGLEDYNPTHSYELETAVKDKYLTPPRAISVPLKFQREGIKYHQLSEAEKEEYEKTFRDEDSGDMPEEIESSALNAWLFNKNTVDKVLSFLMENGIKVAGGDRLGKTIIFAKNHKHAEFIRQRFDLMFPSLAGHFCQVIDNYSDYAQDLLKQFEIKDKVPHIAISVDMLDTGIDIPEIVNLVFFKPVKSHAKFWQMIGRGTRLCPDLFGPGQDKEHFLIFDFCQNFEFFEVSPEGIKATQTEGLTQRIFKTRLAIAEVLRDPAYSDDENQAYRTALLDGLHKTISGLDKTSFTVAMKLRYVTEYGPRPRWNILSKTDIIDIETELTPLLLPVDNDEMARRFDLLVLSLQLSILHKGKPATAQVERIISIAGKLSRLMNIPAIAAQKTFVQEAARSDFWKSASLSQMEAVREALRGLVKFLDRETQRIVYTNFQDELQSNLIEEKDLQYSSSARESYRLKAERFIREHQHHLTVQKLKSNMPITAAELEEFERLLFAGDGLGAKEEFIKELGTEQPLGEFIRTIVGLDVNAAKEAFGEFLGKGNLNPDQIQFINTLIDYLSRNGTVDKAMLVDSPFTEINDMGIFGLFSDPEADKIISILDQINANTRVA